MKNPTIESLRKSGYKVRVIHRHWYKGDHGRVNVNSLAEDGNPSVTDIDITTPDGRDASGYAYRAKGDQYNRKIGNAIALGRALKQF